MIPHLPDADGGFCDNIDALAEYLIDIGGQIVHGVGGTPPGIFIDPAIFFRIAALVTFGGFPKDAVHRHVLQLHKYIGNCDILRGWIDGIRRLMCGRVEDVVKVMAVRIVLESWKDCGTLVGTHTGYDAKLKLSVAPEIFGIGGGVDANAKGDEDISYSQSMKMAVVPLLDIVDQVIRRICPTGIPGIGECIDSYIHATISLETLKCLISINGGRWDTYEAVVAMRSWRLSPSETVYYGRIAGANQQHIDDTLKRTGYVDDAQRQAFMFLYDRQLTPVECMVAADKRSGDDFFAGRYGLDNWFVPNVWDQFSTQLTAAGITKDVARMQWRSHWIFPQYPELERMYFRLIDNDGVNRPTIERDDIRNILRSQGFTDWSIDRMIETINDLPSVRQHSMSAQYGQYSKEDIDNVLRRTGFGPDDARKLAVGYYYSGIRRAFSQAHGMTATTAYRLLKADILTASQVFPELEQQGYTWEQVGRMAQIAVMDQLAHNRERWGLRAIRGMADEAVHAYEVGAASAEVCMAALLAAGCPEDSAGIILQEANLRNRVKIVRAGIAAVRRSMMIGGLNPEQAAAALLQMGIAGPRIDQYILEWTAQLTFPRRVASAQQILRWTEQGYLPIGIARQRLVSLGFGIADIELMTAEIRAKIGELQEKEAAARQKQAAQAAKEAAKVAKQAESVKKQAQATVRRFWSVAKLKSLYARHIISEDALRRRMREGGFDDAEINAAVEDAKINRQALDAKAAKHGASGVESDQPPVE